MLAHVSSVSTTELGIDFVHLVSKDPPIDRIDLIKTAFNAFTAIGRTFDPGVAEEIRAIAVSLYAGK